MTDETTHQKRLKRNPHLAGFAGTLPKDADGEVAEASCGAFGYLRGLRDSSAAVEFRFRDGNSIWFAYSLLGTWRYNPSCGLLLKFTGDVVTLVLIKGSNLDRPLNEGAIDLIHAGLQRHRVLWVREMSPDEIRQVGEKGPTIDSIEVAEFESNGPLKEWLKKKAPEFIHEPA
jgi:hypothetical protein